MTRLEELFANPPSAHGCPVCGELAGAKVFIQVRELDSRGRTARDSRSVSRQRSFCADHAAELFGELLDLLTRKGCA